MGAVPSKGQKSGPIRRTDGRAKVTNSDPRKKHFGQKMFFGGQKEQNGTKKRRVRRIASCHARAVNIGK